MTARKETIRRICSVCLSRLRRTTTLIEQLIFGLGLHHSIITGSVRGASDDAARYHGIYSLSNSFDMLARRTEREMYTGHGAVKDFPPVRNKGPAPKANVWR